MAHCYNHIFGGRRIARTARWFESLGMRPGHPACLVRQPDRTRRRCRADLRPPDAARMRRSHGDDARRAGNQLSEERLLQLPSGRGLRVRADSHCDGGRPLRPRRRPMVTRLRVGALARAGPRAGGVSTSQDLEYSARPGYCSVAGVPARTPPESAFVRGEGLGDRDTAHIVSRGHTAFCGEKWANSMPTPRRRVLPHRCRLVVPPVDSDQSELRQP